MGQRDKEHVEKRERWRIAVLATIAKGDFPASTMAVAFYISFKINSDFKICWTSQKTIAEAVGMKPATVRELIALLRKHGFLAVDRAKRTTSNRYVLALNHAPIWPRIVSSNGACDRGNSSGREPKSDGLDRGNGSGRDRWNSSGPTAAIPTLISLIDNNKILTPPSFSMNLADDRSSDVVPKEAFGKDARGDAEAQPAVAEPKRPRVGQLAFKELSASIGTSVAPAGGRRGSGQ
jgi:hypothetical protein